MAIDPSISLGVKTLELPNQLAQYGQLAQLQGLQNQNQLHQLQMQEAQATAQERNALRQLNPNAPDYEQQLFRVNPQLGIAYRKEAATTAAQKALQATHEFELKNAKAKFQDQAKRNLSANPSDDNVRAWGQDAVLQGISTQEEATATVQQLLQLSPEKRVQVLAQSGATAGELKPQMVTENLGGTSRVSAIPAFGGVPAVLSTATKTATPGELLSNQVAKGQLAVSQGQLAVSQGQLQVARDRLAKEGAQLDPTESAAVSKAVLEGRLDPNRITGRNAKILAATLMADPTANLLELGVSAAGATASEKALATQTAKMSTAANEAGKMVNVVRDYSSKIDRTEYPDINAIQNAVDRKTGGKEIVQLNTSINALVNSYARAISPTGQPTVSDKNHAREIINSAYSQGQIGAILDVMQQEMDIAKGAAVESSAALKASREAVRGRPAAGASKAGVDTSNPLLK